MGGLANGLHEFLVQPTRARLHLRQSLPRNKLSGRKSYVVCCRDQRRYPRLPEHQRLHRQLLCRDGSLKRRRRNLVPNRGRSRQWLCQKFFRRKSFTKATVSTAVDTSNFGPVTWRKLFHARIATNSRCFVRFRKHPWKRCPIKRRSPRLVREQKHGKRRVLSTNGSRPKWRTS